MSKKKKPSRCLVVDASVAQAAGPPESTHPTGRLCREFLMKLRGVCHRIAWTEAIKIEWEEHESTFARQWRLSMFSLKKIQVVDVPESTDRERVRDHCQNGNILAKVLKDWHLIEAALAADNRIASLDKVRDHLANLAVSIDSLRSILWVNPTASGEKAIQWLADGAPDQKKRRLSHR